MLRKLFLIHRGCCCVGQALKPYLITFSPLPGFITLRQVIINHSKENKMKTEEEDGTVSVSWHPLPLSNFSFINEQSHLRSEGRIEGTSFFSPSNSIDTDSEKSSLFNKKSSGRSCLGLRKRNANLPLASVTSTNSTTTATTCAVDTKVIDNGANNEGFIEVKKKERGKTKESMGLRMMMLKHPLALLAMVPDSIALFAAGAIAGAASKTLTAPLDRAKLLMQTHGVRISGETAKKGIGFIQAIVLIKKEEGMKGYWKGNLPQVMRILPYSAVQLFSYEIYKKLFKKKDGELSVIGRLAAGACAGMTSTFVTYPLDVLRLRLAVEPGSITMSQVALNMLREEGIASFYSGLGPSLLSIAPYIAVNFCVFDLVKKSLPEKYQKRPETSVATALVSATLATLMCYPLDTVRRQMQMKNSPFNTIFDAFPGIVERDGLIGLYRGFVPNALKTLPSSSIRLTTFDTVKSLIKIGQKELQSMMEEKQNKVVS